MSAVPDSKYLPLLDLQVVDDILDFTRTAEQLGKPQVRAWPAV